MAPNQRVRLEDARARAIELLATTYADGAIDIDEYERRVEAAEAANSVAAIDELIADVRPEEVALVPVGETAPAVASAPSTALAIAAPETGSVVSVFGGTSRKGAWVVPRRLRVWSVFGGSDIDFRDAQLAPGVHEVKLFTLMGGTNIIVPPGLHVQVDGSGIMGGFDDDLGTPTPPDPNKPILRITGVAIMGGVDVQERYPGESGRQARRRRKRERKLRDKQVRAELEAREAAQAKRLEPPK